MDLAGLFPRYINIRRGAYVGLIISMGMCPWTLLASATRLIAVLNGFTIFFSPICAIQICDYFVLRHRRLKLSDMFHPRREGVYYFAWGVNWRALMAWFVAWVPLVPGLAGTVGAGLEGGKTPGGVGMERFYALNVEYSFAVAFVVYWAVNLAWPPRGLGETDREDVFGTFAPEELGVLEGDSSANGSVSDGKAAGSMSMSDGVEEKGEGRGLQVTV